MTLWKYNSKSSLWFTDIILKKNISWVILAKEADRNQEWKEQKGKKPSFLTCDPAAIVSAKYCRMQDPLEFWAHGKPGGHAIQERLISQGHPTPTTQMDVEAERSSLSEEQDIAEFVSEILQLWNWCLLGEGRFSELNAGCDAGLSILVLPPSSARSCFSWAVVIYRVIFPQFSFHFEHCIYIKKKYIAHLSCLFLLKESKTSFLD